ncbi:MAG: PEGA domain-containing protein [Lentisphaerae bacterium]|nr:PEGA domain-containing protein [Lentisphaerota bacterium]
MNLKTSILHARLLLGGLCLCALGAFAAGSAPDVRTLAELYVASTPAGAACNVDGIDRGVTPVTITGLPAGEHLAILSKNGYRDLRRTVTLAAGARAALDEALDAERGLVLLQTDPSGARVSIDGADRGLSPLILTDLPLGPHRARAEAPGCFPGEVNLTLDSRAPVKVVMTLPPSTATIDVTSQPLGAAVILDGAAQGRTPLTLERIPEGQHRLQVQHPGYAPFEETLQAEAGSHTTVDAPLAPLPARLRVVTEPPGARVYLDNALHGESPVTIDDLPPGAYRLRVEATGYATAGRTVTLALAANVTEEVRLDSNSGTLQLITEPAGATVFVDSRKVGITESGTNATDQVSDPLLVRLVEAGTHTLQLTKQGFYAIKKTIEISKNETLALHETLKRRFIPDYEVVTAAGIDRGVLAGVDPDGSVRLEVRPGVIKRIRAKDIKGGRPIQQQALPDLEEEAPADAAPTPAAPVPR